MSATCSVARRREAWTPRPEQSSVEAAWLVLEAANDLGDHVAVEACRRVIDANLTGAAIAGSDLSLVLDYFR